MVLMKKPSVSESPLRQGTRTCPRWDLAETEACGGGKVFSMDLSDCFGIFREFIGGRPRAEEPQGAHKPARRGPPGRGLGGLWGPLVALCLGSQVSCVSSVPEKIFSEVLFRLDSV